MNIYVTKIILEYFRKLHSFEQNCVIKNDFFF
jgi:hypothetical protein